MPLLAVDSDRDGAVIDLTAVDESIWESIWRMRTGDRLRCRECGQGLHAKQRHLTGTRYFAHNNLVPFCATNGETERHLRLKELFATAFRRIGWATELEVIGNGWRVDVLASSPSGARVAIEIQISPIAGDEVEDRTYRHVASGLTTMWVVRDRRPMWAELRPSVVVDSSDRVVNTVVLFGKAPACAVIVARPTSIERFVERYAEGRLTSVVDELAQWPTMAVGLRATCAYQLDRCGEALLAAKAAELEQEAARAAREEAARIADLEQHADVDRLMVESLSAFVEWYPPSKWNCWFGSQRSTSPDEAVAAGWDRQFGILILIGVLAPTRVLAIAEPRLHDGRVDPRVLRVDRWHRPCHRPDGVQSGTYAINAIGSAGTRI